MQNEATIYMKQQWWNVHVGGWRLVVMFIKYVNQLHLLLSIDTVKQFINILSSFLPHLY